jgi:hypothetical protein
MRLIVPEAARAVNDDGHSHYDTPNTAGCDGAHPSSQETTDFGAHGGRRAVGAGHTENCCNDDGASCVLPWVANIHPSYKTLPRSGASLKAKG